MTEDEILKVIEYLNLEKHKCMALQTACVYDRNRLISEGRESTFDMYMVDHRFARCEGKVELLNKYINKLKTEFGL